MEFKPTTSGVWGICSTTVLLPLWLDFIQIKLGRWKKMGMLSKKIELSSPNGQVWHSWTLQVTTIVIFGRLRQSYLQQPLL